MATTIEVDLRSLSNEDLTILSASIEQALVLTPYSPPPDSNHVSIKDLILTFLRQKASENDFHKRRIIDFCLCCSALASAEGQDSPSLYWIPKEMSVAARSAVRELARLVSVEESAFVEGMMPEVFPLLKGVIKETCVVTESEDVVSSTVKAPVAHAIIAAHQFRWFVTQITYPQIGKMSPLVIPCALTALDHWSPEVKDQGIVCLIHLAKNVNSAELSWYEEPILDACLRNISVSDEIWHHMVEMSVLSLTSILRRNPRNSWFDKILTEMLSHLERQPTNKDRRISWLLCIQPVLDAMGLVLLAHFSRLFPLFFHWLHADDDKTLTLVLERILDVVKLTWIRTSPCFNKLVDELAVVYKESSMRKEREAIRAYILQILLLLKKCQGPQFDKTWGKHKEDQDLNSLTVIV